MNKILLRFEIVKNNRVIEVYLDSRLSFSNNFKLLANIIEIKDIDEYLVYDANKGIFLDRNVPICNFDIKYFMSFKLF